MNVLVIGGGGREHALAWKLGQSALVKTLLVAPGSVGIALEPRVECVNVAVNDFMGILKICRERRVDFVVVGPDQALADGLVDYLEAEGIPTFGPVKEAAKIEWSKAFSKELMREANIPTARFETFTEAAAARNFLTKVTWGDGWVVKADGLALGKGVVVCESREEAIRTAEEFLSGTAHGAAGRRIVVEERLLGREVSVFTLCDGQRGVLLGMACDYKRIFDGDTGPNTGGMGAFSPADWLPGDAPARIQSEIVAPLLAALRSRGTPYKGILFSGLMITATGPKVIEFNARFGDPETQVVLPLLDEDLLPWLRAARDGKLDAMAVDGPKRKDLHGVHVVLAAAGYPGVPEKGAAISLPAELLPQEDESERLVKLFFAGVARMGSELVANGGRVLGLTALAAERAEARRKAYEILPTVKFAGSQRRSDVGR